MRGYPIVGRYGRSSIAFLAVLLVAAAAFPALAAARPSPTPFSIEPGSFEVTPSTRQAGSHPDLTIAFAFDHSAEGNPFNDVKSTVVDLPPGFAGAPSAVPACSTAQLFVIEEALKSECPLDSQVGTISVEVTIPIDGRIGMTLPLFNMGPAGAGIPARLGFRALVFSQFVPLSIRPTDGGLSVDVPDVPPEIELSTVSITVWGVPAAPSHDAQRGQECFSISVPEPAEYCLGEGSPAGIAARPFLDSPTRCGTATARIEADSWEAPESWSEAAAEAGPIAECERVPFAPEVALTPTSGAAESPTGLDLSILEPQSPADPEAPVSSSLERASVELPEGLSIDPAAAAGLGVCTPQELERESVPAATGGCPPGSKIGSAEIDTPLLGETAVGSIYMAKPADKPPNSLFVFYLVARAPGGGGFVELNGRLQPNRHDGRLRIELDEIPQLPLSRIALHLPAGADSLFVTPAACGSYAVHAELTPSSDPTAPRPAGNSFAIDRGPAGASCPAAGRLPFQPAFAATSRRTLAGAFAPLDLRLTREQGEAPLAGLSLELPPGLVANLSLAAPCPEAALAAIGSRSGAEERAEPSCPAESEIGHVSLAVGVGSRLAHVGGSVYLAGSYRGSPRSVVLVVPALLGSFDLGTVAMRETLNVDPRSGAVAIGSVGSDPIPQLLEGFPLHLRELDVNLDRKRFLRNPTACRPLSLLGTATALDSGLAAAGQPSSTSTLPFRATDCGRLRFAPRVGLRLLGAFHRNGHPGFRVVLASGRDEAGIAGAAIDLPRTELLDSGHVRGTCTSPRFAAGRCPASSAYGFAKASTPFLAEPLQGHVYLRATRHGLPSLAVALKNRETSLDFVARLEAAGGRLRIAPQGVPDVPLSRLVLQMGGGRRGLLVNSENLCPGRLRAAVRFRAQNGRRLRLQPPLHVSCRQNDAAAAHSGGAKGLRRG